MSGAHGKRPRSTSAAASCGAAAGGENDAVIALPGRYVSKRERLMLGGQTENNIGHGKLDEHNIGESAEQGRVRGEALFSAPDWLERAADDGGVAAAERFAVPRRLMCRISSAHSRPATCVRWSPHYGHLLTSAGMDGAVKIWSPFQERPEKQADASKTSPICPVRVFHGHRAAVKDTSWTNDAAQLLTASLDATVRVADVESGATVAEVCQGGAMSVCRPDPSNPQIFATGGDARVGSVRFWDLRMLGGADAGAGSDSNKSGCNESDSNKGDGNESDSNKGDGNGISSGGRMCNHSSSAAAASSEPSRPVLEFPMDGGDLLDLAFDPSGSFVVTSADCTRVRGLDKGLRVWDVRKSVSVSNQIYMEGYTCPSVAVHPSGSHFIAQSNGSYIAIFSCTAPYKLNKYKRFEGGHEVGGFGVSCVFCNEGSVVVSGSADGKVVYYDWKNGSCFGEVVAHEGVCTVAVAHPALPSVVATCGWDGDVCIWTAKRL
ncbi:hypothetical protein CLOM_g15837 [Closterium sp. NIES-68]|nr:hypothetical protein CLOM_g15837 [Closterium sp. NIES-68]GJP72961.1 hypothetical protein CLOP_g3728 [Closterium sp. NIES-67]